MRMLVSKRRSVWESEFISYNVFIIYLFLCVSIRHLEREIQALKDKLEALPPSEDVSVRKKTKILDIVLQ